MPPQALALQDARSTLHFMPATVAAAALVVTGGPQPGGGAAATPTLNRLLALAPYLCEAEVAVCVAGLEQLHKVVSA